MSASNSDRNKRGKSLQDILESLMKLCKDLEYIEDYEKDYKIGAPNYANSTQFRAPYLLNLHENTQWAIFTTTSLRDRIKEQQWDSSHLKQINENIKKSFLVYPDDLDESEHQKFISKNEKIESKSEVSSLDALVSQEGLFKKIESFALSSYTPAQQRDKRGKHFEKRVAAVLDNPYNLDKWIHQDPMVEGLHYQMFEQIMSLFNLDRTQVKFMESTADTAIIGNLPSGGPAKTDVLTTVTYNDNRTEHFTISCKRTKASSVSVHQYSADSFANVLDPNNTELRRVLNEFQKHGNVKDMSPADINLLTELIQPHLLKLCKWALGGDGGEGNRETQWAQYIVIYDDVSKYTMHSVNEYATLLANNENEKRTFGTPFSWTYQGTRGTNIQLKCPIKLG